MRQLYPEPVDDVDPEVLYAPPPGPHVRANMISSLDGAAYLKGRTGELSGRADQSLFALMRGLADVILVGAGTVGAEQYGPARPSAARRGRRIAAGLSEIPPIAVVSARLALPFDSVFFKDAKPRPILVTTERAPKERVGEARRVADVIVAGGGDLDARSALRALSERGLDHVLCEGGPVLLANLLAASVVDELCLTLAPVLVGGDPRRIVDGVLPATAAARLASVCESEGYLFTRYQLEQACAYP